MSYPKLASSILSCFVYDIDIKTLCSLCDSAYTVDTFGKKENRKRGKGKETREKKGKEKRERKRERQFRNNLF